MLLGAFFLQSAQPHTKLKVGDEPPDRFGKTQDGERVRLANYRGKIVIVSFWASWCGPCRKELPLLAAIQKLATRDKIVVVSVVWLQDYRDFRSIAKILKDGHMDLSLVLDENGFIGNAYDVNAIPHMIIIGRDGKIAAIHVGYGEEEVQRLVDEINSLWRSGQPGKSSDSAPS